MMVVQTKDSQRASDGQQQNVVVSPDRQLKVCGRDGSSISDLLREGWGDLNAIGLQKPCASDNPTSKFRENPRAKVTNAALIEAHSMGGSLEDIAKRLDNAITKATISRRMQRLGLESHLHRGGNSSVTDAEIIEAYHQGGSNAEIGKRLKTPLGASSVRERLMQLDLKSHLKGGGIIKVTDEEFLAAYNEGGSNAEIGRRLSKPLTEAGVSKRIKKLQSEPNVPINSYLVVTDAEIRAAHGNGGSRSDIAKRLDNVIKCSTLSNRLDKLGLKVPWGRPPKVTDEEILKACEGGGSVSDIRRRLPPDKRIGTSALCTRVKKLGKLEYSTPDGYCKLKDDEVIEVLKELPNGPISAITRKINEKRAYEISARSLHSHEKTRLVLSRKCS